MIAKDWQDYEILATGGGEKLERWGKVYLLRPDPQVIWAAERDLRQEPRLNAIYNRDASGGGCWERKKSFPEKWTINYKDLTFSIMPMGFKHTGLFPEQAVNWEICGDLIKRRIAEQNKAGNKTQENGENKTQEKITVLNLFAYTGGATVALAKAGAKVTHVDAAKGMVDRAKENCALSGLSQDAVRFIVDDCKKFILREIKRGNHYDAILLDPPSYGRGPNGEMWKIETDLFDLCALTKQLLSDNPLFYLINSYTTGLNATVMQNIVAKTTSDFNGFINCYEVCLPTNEKNILLPCGNSAIFSTMEIEK